MNLWISSLLAQNIVVAYALGIPEYGQKGTPLKVTFLRLFTTLLLVLPVSLITIGIYQSWLLPYGYEEWVSLVYLIILSGIGMLEYFFLYKIDHHGSFTIPFLNTVMIGLPCLTLLKSSTMTEVVVQVTYTVLGYSLLLYILLSLEKRLKRSPLLKGMKNLPILLITLGIISLIITRYV